MTRQTRLATLTLFVALLAGYFGVLPLFGQSLQTYFDITLSQYGVLLSIGLVPSALAALAAGQMVDRLGPRRTLRVGFAGTAAALVIAALGWNWKVMLAATMIAACFASAIFLAVQAYLAQTFPGRRRRVISLHLVSLSLWGVVLPLWVELLTDLEAGSPNLSFSTVLHAPFGAIAVLMGLAALLYRPSSIPAVAAKIPDVGPTENSRLFGGGVFWLVAMMVMHGTCDSAAHMWMARVWDSEPFAASPIRSGVVLAAYSAAYAGGRSLLSILPERSGRKTLLIAPGIVGGGLFALGMLLESPTAAAVGYVAGAAIWSVEFPVAAAMIAEVAPRRMGRLLAIAQAGEGFGAFAVLNGMGLVGQSLPGGSLWTILLIPAVGFPVVGLCGGWWLLRHGNRRVD